MAGLSGIGNNTNDIFSNFLGTNSTDNTNQSGFIGDMALIRSGAYKKALKAYYKNEDGSSSGVSGKESTEVTEERTKALAAKDSASQLRSIVEELRDTDFSLDNRDKSIETVKKFIEKYNSLVEQGSKPDNKSILQNTLWLTKETKANAGLLEDVGIKIAEGNKLELDEEKFKKVRPTDLESLFKGNGFSHKLLERSDKIIKAAAAVASANTHASAYTFSGQYDTGLSSSGTAYDKQK